MDWDVFKIDGMQVPLPPVKGSFSISKQAVANTATSEAGTTIRDVRRSGVHVIKASFVLAGPQMAVLSDMVKPDSVNVTVWSPDKNAEDTFSCWLSSGFTPQLLQSIGPISSDKSTWQADLEFTEF